VEAWGRRAAMGGWTEEVCFALLRRAQGLERMGEPWPAILAAYLEAFQARPQRAEALVELARACRLSGRYALGYLFARQASAIAFPEHDRLFVALDAYRWRARDEQALCAYYSGRPGESFDLCTELLKQDALPEAERERVMANRDFCVAAVKDVTLAYPSDAVRRLTRQVKRRRGRPQITLSITSCRRRPLFEKTLDSFLSCCEDGDRIGRWLCVDDGSCEADRARMQERYPFFEFVMKSPGEKGHARSMNLILERLESPYWLHLEDDWHFFVGERYVLKSLAVLDDDPRIGQVLFNRNYGETTACRTIAGGQVCRTRRSGERYRRHQHVAPGTEDWRRLLGDMPPGSRTNAWWPHYSLRPALARTAAIRDVGGFSESADHFELEFARRYTARGWTSAFLDAIHCLHIGRLTSEPPGSGPPNAYALNGEPQFGRPPEGPEPAP
jgi:GT2 family glycosyltransferase